MGKREAKRRGKADWRGWSYSLLSRCRGELMGLALLAVLLFHAFYLPVDFAPLAFIKERGFCGVDVFILLSAMGLAMSLSRRKEPLGKYYLRRFVRVLPTYWLVVGLYGLALRLAGRTTLTAVGWTLSTLFYWLQGPNYFNWYIPGLLAFYVITPLCFWGLKRCRFREVLVAVLSLGAFGLSLAANAWGFGHLNDVIYRIPVYLMGLLMGINIAGGRPLTLGRLCVWAAGLVLAPLVGTFTPMFIPTCFLFALFCVILCLGASRLLALLPEGGFRKWLRVLGECSLEIYLLNVVFVLEHDLLAPILNIGPNHYVYYAVTIPLNILLGIGLHHLLKRPLGWLSRKVLGERKG